MELTVSIIFITVLILLIKLLIYHYKRIDLYKAGYKIPGPEPVLPIIGNAYLFFGRTENTFTRIMSLLDNFKSSPVRFWLGQRLSIVLFDPEYVKIVLHSPKTIEKGDLTRFFHPWLGTGLFTAPAKKWKIHRKLITPAFHPKILETFIDTMDKKSEILVQAMESKINKNEFDILAYISLCTFDITCETLMGISSNEQIKGGSSYLPALRKMMEIIFHRITKIWLHPEIIFNLTKLSKEQENCIKKLHQFTREIVEIKRQNSENFDPKRKPFLDLLIELPNEGCKLTTQEVYDEVDSMMLAANDTSSTISSFVIFMLANFPDIQEKCYKELLVIYGDKISECQTKNKDLCRMKYLERVIKETLRLFPVAPLSIRHVTDDLNIGSGYTLPKDSTIILSILQLHRSAEFWDDPLRFNPDRFSIEQEVKRHPYVFVPFGAGPRTCLGSKYAMMTMKIILSKLLRNFVFIKDKHVNIGDIKLKADSIIRAVNPLTVKIIRRN